jgi:lysophospholipase L1-like esterase
MKADKSLFFILLVIVLLVLLSVFFPEDGVSFGGRRLFFPTVEEVLIREKRKSVTEKMQELEQTIRIKVIEDSVSNARISAFNDSSVFYMNFFNSHPARIHLPGNDLTFFDRLFENAENCGENEEIIHILHYGDSQIEADRITGLIRQKLQEKFGGKGPGLLPLVQPIPSSAVAQTASENISRFIISGNHMHKANHNRYGILGQVAEVSGRSSVTITSRNWKDTFENVKEFSKIRLFVSNNSPDFKVVLHTGNEKPIVRTASANSSAMHALTWNLNTPVKKFTLELFGHAEVTALSIDGNQGGIAVDNIPLRGSSGTFFSGIAANSIAPTLKELNVQLIIMEFGGNMTPYLKNDKVINKYKEDIAGQIRYLAKLCPTAKIILIGPSDMSTKINGRLKSYPLLSKNVQALKEAALENNAAFWNMYEVMGGEDSMIDWVREKPSLAAPDYIHFTPRGANRIAEMFCESLMNYYDFYRLLKNNQK